MASLSCALNFAHASPITTTAPTGEASTAIRAENLAAMEARIALLQSRIEKLRELDEASAPPSPLWLWGLGTLLAIALLALFALFLHLRKLQAKSQPSTAKFAHLFEPATTTGNTLGPTIALNSKLHALAGDDLHVVEYEAMPLDDEEYDFGVGLGTPETWTGPKPTTTPQKRLAAVDLMEDDLLFASEVAASDKLLQVEEMTDALQEAKFWVALNRNEHAITILEEEVALDQTRSPGSWIYLLDLYRETGDKEKFNAIRERFHRHFNGQIPPWHITAEVTQVTRLADFPHITAKLAKVLPTENAIPYLESLLLDDRNGTREGFAYRVYCDIVQLLENVKQGRREMIFA